MTSASSTKPVSPELERARERLAEALDTRDRLRDRFDASIGTSLELGAYARLRRAGEEVAAWDRWLRWLESEDFLRAPTPEDRLMEGLLEAETPAMPPGVPLYI
ncbi:MAG TPA: hypothetical protein VF752_12505 [Thermoleophilaceae bacterium]